MKFIPILVVVNIKRSRAEDRIITYWWHHGLMARVYNLGRPLIPYVLFSNGNSGYQFGCTIGAVSAQWPVEHVKNMSNNHVSSDVHRVLVPRRLHHPPLRRPLHLLRELRRAPRGSGQEHRARLDHQLRTKFYLRERQRRFEVIDR